MARNKKRKDGRYMTQIYLGRGDDGKKKFKSVYAASLAELKDKETEIRHQLGKGLDLIASRDSFARWADDWMNLRTVSNLSERQKANYQHAVDVWKEELNGLEIGEVRPDDIERLLVRLQQSGKAPRTVNFYRATIRSILQRAVGRVISYNPADRIELVKSSNQGEKRRALTAEEQGWILNTPHRAQPAAVIMMLSGLRRGELAALTWNDVDLIAHTITVNKTVEYKMKGSVPELRDFPKSDSSRRVVDIPKMLVNFMAQMPRTGFLVYPDTRGRIMTASAWGALWSSYMRVLNEKYGIRTLADLERMKQPGRHKLDMTIPPITMHWLRHTFCTLMYLAGVDVVQASAQMGHADVSTTLRIYTHLDAQHKRKSVEKLDAYLAGQS